MNITMRVLATTQLWQLTLERTQILLLLKKGIEQDMQSNSYMKENKAFPATKSNLTPY